MNLESEEMIIEKHVQLERDKIVDAEYSMDELVDLTWGREICLGLDLNEKPMNGDKTLGNGCL